MRLNKCVIEFKNYLPSKIIEMYAKKYNAEDRRKRKLWLDIFFWLAIFSHFQKATNGFLNTLVSIFISNLRKQCKEGKEGAKKENTITRMAISKKFKSKNWRLFKDVFIHLLSLYKKSLTQPKIKLFTKFKDVRAVDTTVIYICKLLKKKFKATNKDKSSIKLHAQFSIKNGIVENIKVTSETVNEKRYDFIGRSYNCLYIIDLGYYANWIMNKIIETGNYFVTRLLKGVNPLIENGRYKGKRINEIKDTIKGNRLDCVVNVNTKYTKTKLIKDIRLVGIKYKGEWYFYLTNIMDKEFGANEIYKIYRYRWEIEIFFNELKHVLRLEDIKCRTENGIMIEIYSALILHLLIRIAIKEASQRSGRSMRDFSFKRSFDIVTNFLRGMFLKFIYEDVDIVEMISEISIILVKTSLKDTHYIRKQYGLSLR